MGVTTWVDRITDESNLWLSAGKAEETGDYSASAALYLVDAAACLERGAGARGALSCYCAAECLSKLEASAEADWMYSEAGRLYAALADHGVSGSIREALWALQRAHACYVLAGDGPEAKMILDVYNFLVRRANPFALESKWLEMPKAIPRRPESGTKRRGLDPNVRRAIEDFYAVREPRVFTERVEPLARKPGRDIDDQESVVSQLG